LDDDLLLQPLLELLDVLRLDVDEQIRDLRIARHRDPILTERVSITAQLAQDFVANGRLRLDVALALAVRARLGQHAPERLARALARHLDDAELRDLGDVGLGLVGLERLFERAHHLLAVLIAIHVDEVDDDHAADVAQPQLIRDLLARLEVGLGDRLLEPARLLADELAGVDVDRRQRLALVDDERAAASQPDLALERAIDLALDAVAVENRLAPV